jgi:hypothetical protein
MAKEKKPRGPQTRRSLIERRPVSSRAPAEQTENRGSALSGKTEEDLAGLAKMRREPAAWLTAFEALLAVRECRAHQVNMDALCDAQEAILQSDQDKVAWEGQRHTLEMERVDWNSKTKICPNRACQMTLAPSDPTCPGCGHQFTVVKNPRVKILMEEVEEVEDAAD